MAIRSRQNCAVTGDDVFERFHESRRTLCQRPTLEVIAHSGTTGRIRSRNLKYFHLSTTVINY